MVVQGSGSGCTCRSPTHRRHCYRTSQVRLKGELAEALCGPIDLKKMALVYRKVACWSVSGTGIKTGLNTSMHLPGTLVPKGARHGPGKKIADAGFAGAAVMLYVIVNSLPDVGAIVEVPCGAWTVRLTTPGPSMSTMHAVPRPLMQEKMTVGEPRLSRTVPPILKLIGLRYLASARTLMVNPWKPSEPSIFTATVKVSPVEPVKDSGFGEHESLKAPVVLEMQTTPTSCP